MELQDLLKQDKTAWYYDDLYGFNLYIIQLKEDKEQEKLYKKINKLFKGLIQEEPSNGKMICIKGDYLIIMKDIQDQRTLTHELIHIVFDLFTTRGIEIRLENDEVFAYYYSYLYSVTKEEILKRFFDKKN